MMDPYISSSLRPMITGVRRWESTDLHGVGVIGEKSKPRHPPPILTPEYISLAGNL